MDPGRSSRIVAPLKPHNQVICLKHLICRAGCKSECNTGIPLPAGTYRQNGAIVSGDRLIVINGAPVYDQV